MGKVYTSKKGRLFAINVVPRPADGDVVVFTQRIFDWCKAQNLSPDEFEAIWLLIRDDFRYDPIPEEEKKKSVSLAEQYCTAIKERLKGCAK